MSSLHSPAVDLADSSHPPILPWLQERWVTVVLTVLALVPLVVPALPGLLEYDRARPAELWRWVTCHLVHFDVGHLFWSLVVFAAVSAVLEPWGRRRLLGCLVASGVAIPLVLFSLAPELVSYRGLSGIDTALFAMALIGFGRRARAEGQRRTVVLCALLGFGLLAKTVFEVAAGAAVFADSTSFEPVPLAHAVGAAVGIAVAVVRGGGAD